MPTPTFTYLGRNGVESVDGEPWFWVARYADGTSLAQFEATDKTFHQFSEIDLGRLSALEVRRAVAGGQIFSVQIAPGMRPVFFMRHQRLHVGTPDEARVKLFCFGYQETVGGRNVKAILTAYPDGSVSLTNDDGRG
jgi:hypothetical protein